MNKIYLAYGSNLNLVQMRYRCPAARALATTTVEDWKLVFRGSNGGAVATIEKEKGKKVPALLWSITEECEKALDRYEGFPHLYGKQKMRVLLDGKKVEAMVYVLKAEYPINSPSLSYYATITEGYRACELDLAVLTQAVFEARGGADDRTDS